jgi:alanyl-tRNA synthetase
MTLTGAEIREKFVAYFRDKRGHSHLPSASLIPDNPTLLLTSAGMVPFVPIFLGQAPAPDPPRAVTVQKCARAGGKDSDIENVGRTARHHTFFEMLGNFSFGDYFKKEIIPWAWEFVTQDLGLDGERIHVATFGGDEHVCADDEAYDIWHKKVGVPTERLHKLSRKHNFWGPPGPTGPCGPCTELYYDRGAENGCSDDPEKCAIGVCDCDRYLEIWNLVFMELFKDENGNFTPLARKNVDTGAGLERITTILQNKANTFETDLLLPILQELEKLSGVKYTYGTFASNTEEYKKNLYLKIITDHTRCITFLVSDGVRTSNIGRGYVLRFIARRAARFGRLLGLTEPFLYKLVPKVVANYKMHYPELAAHEETIIAVIREEEERFAKTIDKGMIFLEELLSGNKKEIDGSEAFNLYATYGFPFELTKEIAEERGKTVDMTGFIAARKKHEEVSSVSKFNVIITGDEALGNIIKEHGQTKFTGYDRLADKGKIIALIKDGKVVDHADEGQVVEVVLDRTPFYAESGGQVGDAGMLSSQEVTLHVVDTKKHEGLHVHRAVAMSGTIEPDHNVEAEVDKSRREQTVLHHSTAHLFHAAIREILGKHVVQAGSQVGPETMRFDFTFEKQLDHQKLSQVENLMNEWVRLNLPVKTVEMGLDEAKRTGAIAMFGEKYGDIVRVVQMGDVSLEFCGGTHVASTGEIGPVKIISEGSIASGVRRVEALSGPRAWHFISQHLNILSQAAGQLKIKPIELLGQIERLQDQLKQKEKAQTALEEKLALANAADLLERAETIGNIRFVSAIIPDLSADGLKALVDHLRNKGENLVVILGTKLDPDKVSLAAGVSNAIVKSGINAGKLIKEAAAICGGGGGGRPELAQAGGKDPSKLQEALNKAKEMVKQDAKSLSS